MSSAVDELQVELTQIQIINYLGCVLTTLIAYEYMITLNQEIACVWKRRLSATSVLLATTRWVMVANQAVSWTPINPSKYVCPVSSDLSVKNTFLSSCGSLYAGDTLLYFLSVIQITLVSALRVYALWHTSKFKHLFFALIFVIGCVPVATNTFAWTRLSVEYAGSPVSNCFYGFEYSESVNQLLLFLTRGSAIATDVAVLILTWVKTFQHWRELRRLKMGSSVSTLLLRDGTIYFLALLAMNIAQILTANNNANNVGYIFTIIQALPSLLVQRFMLNLRRSSRPPQASSMDSGAPDIAEFAVSFRVPSYLLGDIGEPLDHGQSERLSDDTPADSMTTGSDLPETPLSMPEDYSLAGGSSATKLGEHDQDPRAILKVSHDAVELELLSDGARKAMRSGDQVV